VCVWVRERERERERSPLQQSALFIHELQLCTFRCCHSRMFVNEQRLQYARAFQLESYTYDRVANFSIFLVFRSAATSSNDIFRKSWQTFVLQVTIV